MPIEKVYAQLSCSDLERSIVWFEHLFERTPDARPMDGLAEWHHADTAGFQLFRNAPNAGKGTLTLIVSDLRTEHSRLANAGLEPSAIEPADTTSLVRLHDPDRNLVVLAQPGRA
ncbi:glyoxalase/bleomycin resistance/dioxygenase family protein [Notoacmeibacter marinus]|uniref:Glyoxalase/bleomycin resistance/dioxygenase family protein n=1 Tax=Notoacmeibacter marinus TaxID=1876515 RepID=A0A231V1M2_9HYPH|nr:VOC family protein [Notoacmeibacter marinus]OXT01941.1 glyoxalase/bleomycin resistance/dioxygenase family protein [Notoacmeibacter marinus]